MHSVSGGVSSAAPCALALSPCAVPTWPFTVNATYLTLSSICGPSATTNPTWRFRSNPAMAPACSPGGAAGPSPFGGIDCSDFTALTYNMAFGTPLNSQTSQQACNNPGASPTTGGVVLPYNVTQGAMFLPGDLLFIDNPITHVMHWCAVMGVTCVNYVSSYWPWCSPARPRPACCYWLAARCCWIGS